MTLHTTINELASTFAHDLLRTFRKASLQDILAFDGGARHGRGRPPSANGPTPAKKSKRLARRSLTDITKMAEKIVALVKGSKKGISAEGIKVALKIERRELPRPLGMALKSKKISKRGKKRATMYFGH